MKTILVTILLTSLVTINEWNFKANTEESNLIIKGTSSVHDWESTVNDFTVSGVMSDTEINNLDVQVIVKSISSGKSIMDDKTYDALKAKKYGTVFFKSTKLEVSGNDISGTGTLELAGAKKEVLISAKVVNQTNESFTIQGEVDLDMTEYGIEPPTAMFGTLETGEIVTIKYQLLLNK